MVVSTFFLFFFFKQKTAYEMRISDWSLDVCSSDLLVIGGFLVTGGANGFNQVIEKIPDSFMNRTRNRPLPAGRMTRTEVIVLCVIMSISGILILGFFTTWLTALFGALSDRKSTRLNSSH